MSIHISRICHKTYYAGNSRTFKAVATTAHCAIDGYISDIAALTAGGEAAGKKTRISRHSEVNYVAQAPANLGRNAGTQNVVTTAAP